MPGLADILSLGGVGVHRRERESQELMQIAHEYHIPAIQAYAKGDPTVTPEQAKFHMQQVATAVSTLGKHGKEYAKALPFVVESAREKALTQKAMPQPAPVPGPAGPGQIPGTLSPVIPAIPGADSEQNLPPIAAAPGTSPVQPGSAPIAGGEGFQASPQGIAGRTAALQSALYQASIPLLQEQTKRKLGTIQQYVSAGYTPEQAIDAIEGRTVPFVPMQKLTPGEELHVAGGPAAGQLAGISTQPRTVEQAPGANTLVLPPVGIGGQAGQTVPSVIPGPPPLPDKTTLDALTSWAGSHGLADWKAVPPADWPKARAAWAESSADPELRQARLQSQATLEAVRMQTMQMQQAHLQLAQQARSDRSWAGAQRELDILSKPLVDSAARVGRLMDTLDQRSPQADALIAPELLTAMAGGMGSGLRMNEAEIARIVGGRSKWQDLKAAINKWQLDPKAARSITPAQDAQIRSLVQAVSAKLQRKQEIINSAYSRVLQSDDPKEHRTAIVEARKQFVGEDLAKPQAQTTAQGIEQHSPSTGLYRHSLDGGKTWQSGRLPK